MKVIKCEVTPSGKFSSRPHVGSGLSKYMVQSCCPMCDGMGTLACDSWRHPVYLLPCPLCNGKKRINVFITIQGMPFNLADALDEPETQQQAQSAHNLEVERLKVRLRETQKLGWALHEELGSVSAYISSKRTLAALRQWREYHEEKPE